MGGSHETSWPGKPVSKHLQRVGQGLYGSLGFWGTWVMGGCDDGIQVFTESVEGSCEALGSLGTGALGDVGDVRAGMIASKSLQRAGQGLCGAPWSPGAKASGDVSDGGAGMMASKSSQRADQELM